jgi:hypothetical protein
MIPLLSTAYLAFISPDAISEISGSDLEKVGLNSHTQLSAPSFQFDAGLITASCPIMGLADSAQGYDCSGNTLHRHTITVLLVTFYFGLQQAYETITI